MPDLQCADKTVPRRLLLNRVGLLVGSVLAISPLAQQVAAQTDPYSVYGGKVETEAKNAAIEACEYRVLVEQQRCNSRANKSACIEEVHRECREEFADKASKEDSQEDN